MLARPAFTVRPEIVAHADARAQRLGLSRSAYVRAGLALAAAASDDEVRVAALLDQPSRASTVTSKEATSS